MPDQRPGRPGQAATPTSALRDTQRDTQRDTRHRTHGGRPHAAKHTTVVHRTPGTSRRRFKGIRSTFWTYVPKVIICDPNARKLLNVARLRGNAKGTIF